MTCLGGQCFFVDNHKNDHEDNTIYVYVYTNTKYDFVIIKIQFFLLIYIKIYKLARLGNATPSVAALSENQDTLSPARILTNPLGKL